MAIKKSELYSSLWSSCDELRGGMDASQYKDYVLVLLFVKYVSDKYAGQKDAMLDVPKGGSFADMVAFKGDKEIGDKINKIISKLAEANNLKGVIDVADFNDPDKLGKGKEMVDRLSNLISIFDTPALDFRGNRSEAGAGERLLPRPDRECAVSTGSVNIFHSGQPVRSRGKNLFFHPRNAMAVELGQEMPHYFRADAPFTGQVGQNGVDRRALDL